LFRSGAVVWLAAVGLLAAHAPSARGAWEREYEVKALNALVLDGNGFVLEATELVPVSMVLTEPCDQVSWLDERFSGLSESQRAQVKQKIHDRLGKIEAQVSECEAFARLRKATEPRNPIVPEPLTLSTNPPKFFAEVQAEKMKRFGVRGNGQWRDVAAALCRKPQGAAANLRVTDIALFVEIMENSRGWSAFVASGKIGPTETDPAALFSLKPELIEGASLKELLAKVPWPSEEQGVVIAWDWPPQPDLLPRADLRNGKTPVFNLPAGAALADPNAWKPSGYVAQTNAASTRTPEPVRWPIRFSNFAWRKFGNEEAYVFYP